MLVPMFDPELLAPATIRRFSRREYDELVEDGWFEGEPIELLRGVLVTMSPQGREHMNISAWLTKRLTIALGEPWDVRCGLPYAAGDDSEPEPDVSVSRAGTYLEGHPGAALLLVEVSNSSLVKDPEYWIVDVTGEELRIEVHIDPRDGDYRRVEVLRDGDVLRPTQLPAIAIPVSEIPWKRDRGE